MRVTFLHNAPHRVHAAWAKSFNATFVADRVTKVSIKNVSRFFKTFSSFKKIPKNTDVLLCEGGSQIFSGALWKLLNRKKKLVLIVSDPKMYYLHKMNMFKRFLNIFALKRVDLFIPTSPLMRSLIPKHLPGKRVMVYPFFDKERFKGKTADLSSKNMIFAARICKEKGTDLLVETLMKLKGRFKDARLFLLGISSHIPGQGNLRKQLEKRKIPDVYFTGLIDNPEEFFPRCSIYTSLARIEPAGVSVVEAMYMGLVPVVSRGTGNAYIAARISPELIVSDPDAAYHLIKKLWSDKKLLNSFSKKGKKIALEYTEEESTKLFKDAMVLVHR